MDNRWISKGRSPEEMMKDDAIRRRARMQEAAALANKVSQEDRNKLIKTIKMEKSVDPNADLGELIEKAIIDNWMDDFRYKNGLRGRKVGIRIDGRVYFDGDIDTRIKLFYFMPGNVEGEANFFFTDEKGIVLTDEQFLKCMQEAYDKACHELEVRMGIDLREWEFLLEGSGEPMSGGVEESLELKEVEQKKGEFWYKLLDLPPEIGAKLIIKRRPDPYIYGGDVAHYNLEWPSGVKVSTDPNKQIMVSADPSSQIMVGEHFDQRSLKITYLGLSEGSSPGNSHWLCRGEARNIISDSYAKWQRETTPQLDQLQSAESVMDKANSPLK